MRSNLAARSCKYINICLLFVVPDGCPVSEVAVGRAAPLRESNAKNNEGAGYVTNRAPNQNCDETV